MKSQKGITLIALIVTVIVLLILAAVSLNLISGGNGIITKSAQSVDEIEKATIIENTEIFLSQTIVEYYNDKYNEEIEVGSKLDYIESKIGEGVYIGNDYWLKLASTITGEVVGVRQVASLEKGIANAGIDELRVEIYKGKTLEEAITKGSVLRGIIDNEMKIEWGDFETGNENNDNPLIPIPETIPEATNTNLLVESITWENANATVTFNTTTNYKIQLSTDGEIWNNVAKPNSITVLSGTTIYAKLADDNGNFGTEYVASTPYRTGTINYNANGGTGNVPSEQVVNHTEIATVSFSAVPTKENYEFLGWSTNSSATTATYTSNGIKIFTMGTEDVILYAIWARLYTITLKDEDESIIERKTIYFTEEEQSVYQLPQATAKEEKIFQGWKVGNTLIAAGNSYTITEDVEFIAYYIDEPVVLPQVSIAIDSNYIFSVQGTITITQGDKEIDFTKCEYFYTNSATKLGSNIEGKIGNKEISSITTNVSDNSLEIGDYYLHVVVTDQKGNTVEGVSNKITIINQADYDYSGGQRSIKLASGTYKLECWGAQGGSLDTDYHGGYGGYAVGNYTVTENTTIYINVGGAGSFGTGTRNGGYNGGGIGKAGSDNQQGSGGGASHIALSPGLLRELSDNKSSILIVAGGGGGSNTWWNSSKNWSNSVGGSGGGYIGGDGYTDYKLSSSYFYGNGTGGTQSEGGDAGMAKASWGDPSFLNGSFGQGGGSNEVSGLNGAGGGYYGGGAGEEVGAGGGSGYLNPNLTNKHMTGFEVPTTNNTLTKTQNTTDVSSSAIADNAKTGNGYVRITKLN